VDHRFGVLERRVHHHHQKLVPAPSRNDIVFARAFPKGIGNLFQEQVPRFVTEHIIGDLQAFTSPITIETGSCMRSSMLRSSDSMNRLLFRPVSES
jgi:hypothetical protein